MGEISDGCVQWMCVPLVCPCSTSPASASFNVFDARVNHRELPTADSFLPSSLVQYYPNIVPPLRFLPSLLAPIPWPCEIRPTESSQWRCLCECDICPWAVFTFDNHHWCLTPGRRTSLDQSQYCSLPCLLLAGTYAGRSGCWLLCNQHPGAEKL